MFRRPPQRPDPMTLLAVHNALLTLGLAIGFNFAGAFLLRLGVPLPVVLLLYAAFFAIRFALRQGLPAIVRRIGYRRTLIAAMVLAAAQYAPLARAGVPVWLGVWLGLASFSDVLYWPVYHAAVAAVGSSERRGRQMGVRAALGAAASIAGPLAGGLILAKLGGGWDFALSAALMIAAAFPLAVAPEFPAGPVPTLRESVRALDWLGMAIFFADGWMSAGWLSIWPMVYFLLIGSRFEAFGVANAAAGLVGCLASLLGGYWIDRRRHDGRQLGWVAAALVASIALRVAGSWSMAAADLANLTGIAVGGAYVPLLMSALYERAKRSNGAFRFHLAIEGAWDVGALFGHLAGAAIVFLAPGRISLAVLPAALAVGVLVPGLRRDRLHAAAAAPYQG